MFQQIFSFMAGLLAKESPYRGWIISFLVVVALFLGYKLSRAALARYFRGKAHKPENVQNFLMLYRYVWLALGAIFVIIGLSGSLTTLGISAAFLGMVLGWSLQAPVTGIAAWLMIILKRPFKIGDRVIISGIIGDVIDINLTHIVLNQVGGTVGGEEKSGRGVMIPNATLFQQVIYNYSFETRYILDEVPVLITYESDVDRAEQILIDAARQVTREIAAETGQEPFVRRELADSGIRLRLRYQALAMERQRISSDIVGVVIREFNRNEQVEFCYPHLELLHRPKPAGETDQAAGQEGPGVIT